jgi:uncharacterized protein YybS (DUF2232 family)
MAVIELTGLIVPMLTFLSGIFAPLPLVVAVLRRDLRTGAIALLVAVVLYFLVSGASIPALVMILPAGLLGLLLGMLFKNHVSAGASMVFSVLTAAVFTLVALGLVFWITGVNLFVMGPETRQAMEQMVNWYARWGMIEQPLSQEKKQIFDQTVEMIGQLIPANFVIWSMVNAFLTYVLAGRVLSKLKFDVPPLFPFARWQFPWYVVWVMIVGLALMLSGDFLAWPAAGVTGRNVLYVSGFLYSVAGLSVCVFFVVRWNFSRFIRYFLVGISVFYLPLTSVFLIILGVVDSFVNLRHLFCSGGEQPKGGAK